MFYGMKWLNHAQLQRRLTHLLLDKMSAISKTTYSDAFLWMKGFVFLLKISLKFVLKGPMDNSLACIWIMAWRRIGDKPLSEPMLTQVTDAYMWH